MTRRRPGSVWAAAGLAAILAAGGARAQAPDPLQRELQFASGLVRYRFPDYATRLLDALERAHPDAKGRIARVRVEALTALGKGEEARALIASFPKNSSESLAMLLALGDQMYAMGKLNEAKTLYREFFAQFPKGPPSEIAAFYQESAYKYAQMMTLTGNDKEALAAYEFVLLSKPDPEVERRLQMEVAELCLKVGRAESGAARDAYFNRAKKLCEAVQWKGLDLWFGQSVVILAHLEQIKGDPRAAMSTITTYLPMLKDLDEALKAQNYPLKLSPMAQCRYLLGTLYEEEARRLIAEGKRDEALASFTEALTHLFNVFVKYPDSSWAPEAGARSQRMARELREQGFKVRLPEIDLTPVIEAQLREARALFAQQDFKGAEAKYRMVLNVFPEQPGSVQSLGELGQSYLNLQDKLYLQVAVQELTDRYGTQPRFREQAGNALVRLAKAAGDIRDAESVAWLNQLFFDKFADHRQAASMIYQAGEREWGNENFDLAAAYYARVTSSYTNAAVYLAALNRLAACQTRLADWTNAAETLSRYVAELSFGPALAAARFRLAESYRQMERLVPAINEYYRLVKGLTEEEAKYGATAEEKAANRTLLEQAMFWKAYCYSRLREPAARVPAHQAKAAEDYAAFLATFPKSTLAPNALSSMGVLLLILNRHADAAKAYDRLARDFPDSEQARNAVFARGTSLLEMGQKEQAVAAFEEMFAKPAAFTPAQFFQAGRVMLEQKVTDTARRAFDQALAAKPDKAVEETVRYYAGEAAAAQGDQKGVVEHLEAMMTVNPNSGFTVPAGFLLSRAHAELGRAEPDAARRDARFTAAIRAMNRASRVMSKPEERARRDLELAGIQLLQGDAASALPTYNRLVLLAAYGNARVRPHIKSASEAVMPLLEERNMFADVVENATLYLQQFPGGRLEVQARQWRERAQQKLAMAGATIAPAAPAP